MCFDGASVNVGVVNDLQVLVKRDVGPWVLVIHYVNHNFELDLLDMRKDDPYLVEFEETLKSIFNLYHWSGKLTRELRDLAAVMEEEFSKFGTLKSMRWSASSFRALH